MRRILHIALLALVFSAVPAAAQSAADSLLGMGEQLHRTYRFGEAVAAFDQALDSLAARDSLTLRDSLLIRRIETQRALSGSGLSMAECARHPQVIARRRFPRAEYVLWYPEPDGTPDAEVRYFASDSLGGAGGYDLFAVRWNPLEQRWGPPANLGFPYSSPGDDFDYIPYPERGLALFASNRSCSADSLDVYVVELSPAATPTSVTDPETLAVLCRLDPPEPAAAADDPFAGRDHSALYMKKMGEVRALRDSLAAGMRATKLLRGEWDQAADSLRQHLHELILRAESREEALRGRIARLTDEVREIEMLFLEDGLILDPERMAPAEEPALPVFEWVRREPVEVMHVLQLPQDSVFLRTPSIDFSTEELSSPRLDTLIRRMHATVTDPSQDGVGIAGPQVGIGRRIVLVQRFDREGEPFEAYVNVRIDSLSGPVVNGPEGCLSVPGKRGIVPRHSVITVSYTDRETMERRSETVEGFTAVIFQHECDHLDGILYIDRAVEVFDEP